MADAPITYARAGGPPDNWSELQVRNLKTGRLVEDVAEVNTVEGWVRRHTGGVDPHRADWIVRRFNGRFAIEVKCQHHSVRSLGEIKCRKCGAIYHFGTGGARWIDAKEMRRNG